MYCIKMADYTLLVFATHVRDLYGERSLRLRVVTSIHVHVAY